MERSTLDQGALAVILMLSRVKIYNADNSLIQPFIQTKGAGRRTPERHISTVIIDHHVSLVGIDASPNYIIKLVKARTWHEHVKVFWKRSRTHTEFKGAKLLRSIGIGAPAVFEMGISYPLPWHSEYIGYYVMENLERSGYLPLTQILASCSPDCAYKITENIIKALKILEQNQVLYSDLHLNNIFCHTRTLDISFIDTGAKKIYIKSKYLKKYRKSLKALRSSIDRAAKYNQHLHESIYEFIKSRTNVPETHLPDILLTSPLAMAVLHYILPIAEVI